MSARAVALFLFLSAAAGVAHGEQPLRVPAGFVVEKVAVEPETRYPMFAAWDRRGRLFIAESSGLDLYAELTALTRKCRVRMLEDRDGDGRFEHSTIFAERLVFPMGLVWRDDKLYVADPPDLVTLEDKDGDGVADKRITVLSGFGHRDNGSLHGLIFGPDDALYMTMGQPDGYRLRRGDGSFLEGTSGALIRSRRDGSEPHVIARGFENLVEIIFTSSGEIIGTDNWFQKPSGGIRDALVHLIDGGLYPYAADRGTAQPVTGAPLPPLTLFPAVALSGLEIARSSAWPEAMRGNLFSAQHNSRKVARHVLQRDGASFRADSFDFVTTDDPDIHFSDILEDADGSLLLVDTGSWYVQHCPTGRIRNAPSTGAIYRVRRGDAAKTSDPWGRGENWSTATTAHLLELLADPRVMVRNEAQRNLRARVEAAGEEVIAFAKSSTEPGPRQLAIWTLTSSRRAATAGVRALLHDENPEIVATTVRVLAALRDQSAAEELHRLLRHRAPPVRLAAAEALVHCGNEATLPHLWEALSNAPDRFVEHALVHAAHWLASEKQLHIALAHTEPRVQRAALQLLAQSPRAPTALSAELVLKRIAAPDASLRETALGILRNRRDWAKEAVSLVGAWCREERRDIVPEEHRTAFRELTIAFQNEPEIQNAIAVALASASAETRILALETAKRCTFEQAPRAWIDPIRDSLRGPDVRVRHGAVRAAVALRMTTLDDAILRIAGSGEEPIDLRLEACEAATRQSKLAAPLFQFLVHELGAVNEPLRRLLAAEHLSRCRLSDKQAARALQAVGGGHLISPSKFIAAFQWSESNESSVELVEAARTAIERGWTPAPGEIEQFAARLPASSRSRAAELGERTRATSEDARARLARFNPMIAGGSAETGAEIFFQSRAACSACHAIGAQGGKFGPDLTKIGAIRSPQDILESIVVPSATFAQGYGTFQITATDDTVAIGVISEQNPDTVTLREPSGNERNFARKQIKEVSALPISMMPENLLAALSDAEIRDLLAFLQQLR